MSLFLYSSLQVQRQDIPSGSASRQCRYLFLQRSLVCFAADRAQRPRPHAGPASPRSHPRGWRQWLRCGMRWLLVWALGGGLCSVASAELTIRSGGGTSCMQLPGSQPRINAFPWLVGCFWRICMPFVIFTNCATQMWPLKFFPCLPFFKKSLTLNPL